jgi:hypothetical protein
LLLAAVLLLSLRTLVVLTVAASLLPSAILALFALLGFTSALLCWGVLAVVFDLVPSLAYLSFVAIKVLSDVDMFLVRCFGLSQLRVFFGRPFAFLLSDG